MSLGSKVIFVKLIFSFYLVWVIVNFGKSYEKKKKGRDKMV